MGLRRKLLFWSRVARFNLLNAGLVRALDYYGLAPRLLGQLILVLALIAGGYLIGLSSAPACGPAPDANCIEAQAPTREVPTLVVIAPLATAPLAPLPPAPPPATASSEATAEPAKPNPQSTSTAGARPLSSDEVREMQAWLKAFGFDPGPLDGLPGSRTTAAVKRYQAARQAEETGLLDRSLLRQVRKNAGQS
jgi:hypothetical protein